MESKPLEELAQTPRSRRLVATSVHEAAHVIAAMDCGMKVERASIEPDGFTVGHVAIPIPRWFRPERNIDPRTRLYAEHSILVSLVAVYAEQKFKGRFSHVGAGQDYEDAYLTAINVCESEAEADAFLTWLHIRAQEFVNNPKQWFRIEMMAYMLYQFRNMDEASLKTVYDNANELYIKRNPPEVEKFCVMTQSEKEKRPDFTCSQCPCPYSTAAVSPE